MRMRHAVATAGALAFSLGVGSAGHAETVVCSLISSLPATISAPGTYCLKGNLVTNMASGAAIAIYADDVLLDLNGYTINNLAAGRDSRAVAIYAQDRQNITVKNGTLRGFGVGVTLTEIAAAGSSQGHLIEYMHAEQSRLLGLHVIGRGCLVRHNRVVATQNANYTTYGIMADGPGTRVIDNDVVLAYVGINLAAGNGEGKIALGNRITDTRIGILMNSSTKYRDNLTTNVAVPYSGGTDAGNNE